MNQQSSPTQSLSNAQCKASDYRTSKRSDYASRAEWFAYSVPYAIEQMISGVFSNGTNDYGISLVRDAAHYGRLALGERD